ncbi:MAG TPA: STAS-like domain-containing protein [Methylotenera sp.]|nr:STAS-like domain-containing protein [Methylotenera sp.]HPH04297.1 STAS-like domain-containing protein [Methylotenera sp.]HPM99851.1 STAS-like domain-containing protein [Methylotenera sp.]
MTTKLISISNNFSQTPAGRYYTDGPYSGEKFRTEILYPALIENELVKVDLDGTLGYGSSFLEEAFGGLIRECKMTLEQIESKLEIHSSRNLYTRRIKQYLVDASKIKNK